MLETRKIAHNTIIQLVGKALAVVFSLAIFGLITRHLGQEGFGYFTTVYAFLAVFGILIDLGLQMTTTQLISNPQENQQKILSNALTMRLVASLVFLGLAPVAALAFPYPAIVKLGIALAAMGYIFSSLTATLTSLFQKNLDMKKVAIAEVLAKIVSLIAVTAAVIYQLDLMGIIAAMVLDTGINFIILFSFAQRTINLRPEFDFVVWKKILRKTWPIALTIALNLVYFKGDILIMSLVKSQVEVGLYGASYKILEVLIGGAYMFLGLMLPIFTAVAAIKNFEQLKSAVQKTFDFLMIMIVPMIVGGWFLGEKLMVLTAGAEFAIAGQILKILLLATAAILLAGLFGYVVVALDKQKQMIKFYALNAVLSLAGYYYFIVKYSYWGAAWMTVATEMFILLSAFYVMNQTVRLKLNFAVAAKAVGASLIMAAALAWLAAWRFEILLILGMIVYFIALYWLKGLPRQTLAEIIRIKPHASAKN